MPLECVTCGEPLPPGSRTQCSKKCENHSYYLRHKAIWEARYAELKKEWTVSPNGKRAKISLWRWLKLPEDWR